MKNIKLLAFLSAVVVLFSACKTDDEHDPYIVFWSQDGKWIETTENIPVQLNGTFVFRSEIVYKGESKYEWKIDDGEFEQYSSVDGLNITTIGTYNGMKLQKATWTLDFDDEIVEPGSIITIRLSDMPDLIRTLSFQVQ